MSNFWSSFNNGFMFGMMRNIPFFGCFNNYFCNFNIGYYTPSMIFPPLQNFCIFSGFSNGFAPSPILQNLQSLDLPKFEAKWDVQNYEVPKFNLNNQISQANFKNIPSFTPSFRALSVTNAPNKVKYSTNLSENQKFQLMLKEVLKSEGGYTPNDAGTGPGNKGIRQATYDTYRKNKGLPANHVKNITDKEVEDIYYTMFYKASGAENISDPELAFYVFDAAVNMGVGEAKIIYNYSGNDAEKFKQKRISEYKRIAQNPDKSKYLKNWLNRVENNTAFVEKNFTKKLEVTA